MTGFVLGIKKCVDASSMLSMLFVEYYNTIMVTGDTDSVEILFENMYGFGENYELLEIGASNCY